MYKPVVRCHVIKSPSKIFSVFALWMQQGTSICLSIYILYVYNSYLCLDGEQYLNISKDRSVTDDGRCSHDNDVYMYSRTLLLSTGQKCILMFLYACVCGSSGGVVLLLCIEMCVRKTAGRII